MNIMNIKDHYRKYNVIILDNIFAKFFTSHRSYIKFMNILYHIDKWKNILNY